MARLRGHSELESNLLTLAALNFGFTLLVPASPSRPPRWLRGGHRRRGAAYGPLARRPQQSPSRTPARDRALIAALVLAALRSDVIFYGA